MIFCTGLFVFGCVQSSCCTQAFSSRGEQGRLSSRRGVGLSWRRLLGAEQGLWDTRASVGAVAGLRACSTGAQQSRLPGSRAQAQLL